MAARVHRSTAALSTAANGQTAATWEVVRDYLRALNSTPSTMLFSPAEMDSWRLKWDAAKAEEDRRKRETREERSKEVARLKDERAIAAYSKQTLPYVRNWLLSTRSSTARSCRPAPNRPRHAGDLAAVRGGPAPAAHLLQHQPARPGPAHRPG